MDKNLTLVGTPALTIESVMKGVNPLAEAHFSALNPERLRADHSGASSRFTQSTLRNIELHSGLNPDLMTGDRILDHAITEHRKRHGEDLQRGALIDLAPETFGCETYVRNLYEQLRGASHRAPILHQQANKMAGYATLLVSRAMWHGFPWNSEDGGNIVHQLSQLEGVARRASQVGGEVSERSGIADFVQVLRQRALVQAGNAPFLIVADDRTSGKERNTLHDVANVLLGDRYFEVRDGFRVAAFVVGHSAGCRYDKEGRPATIEGIPLYSPAFRYENPQEKARAEALKREGIATPSGIAEEFKEVTYFRGAGLSLMQGYLEACPRLHEVKLALQRILGGGSLVGLTSDTDMMGSYFNGNLVRALESGDAKARLRRSEFDGVLEVFRPLEGQDVEITRPGHLLKFLVEKHTSSKNNRYLITPGDLHRIFSVMDGDPILRLKNSPGFNPDIIADGARIPVLWPGVKENNSFWTNFSDREWLQFSRSQLAVTAEYLDAIRQMLGGYQIPKEALPFLSLPFVEGRLAHSRRANPSAPAIDCIKDLMEVMDRNYLQHSHVSVAA